MEVVEVVACPQALHTAVSALLVCEPVSDGAGLRSPCLVGGHLSVLLLRDAEVLEEGVVTLHLLLYYVAHYPSVEILAVFDGWCMALLRVL